MFVLRFFFWFLIDLNFWTKLSSRRNALKGHWPYPKTLSDVWWRWVPPWEHRVIKPPVFVQPSGVGDSLNAMCFKIWMLETFYFGMCFRLYAAKSVWVWPDVFNNVTTVFVFSPSTSSWQKAMIRCGSPMQGWVENPMPAHQAGGNTQGVGMPQISCGFRGGVFVWVLRKNVWQTKMP